MMKKILPILFLLACTLTAAAQDYIKQGDSLFVLGKYKEAEAKYRAWNLHEGESPHATRRIAECDKCMELLIIAKYRFEEGNMFDARANYSEILSINPADPLAKKRIAEIDARRPEMNGVTINGITWATRNVDKPGKFAEKPESAGMIYQWNRPKAWPATGEEVRGWDDTGASGSRWEKDNDPCPPGWRVPTREEFELLIDSGCEKVTLNNVPGYRFGRTNNMLFLPAAGYRHYTDGTLGSVGEYGRYWSSTSYGDGACNLNFDGSATVVYSHRTYGRSIRCVAE